MSTPSTAELAAWDQQYLWHPFTQMREWLAEPPLIIERGEGNYLIDTDGHRYLDGVSSLWCNVHGHRKRELDDALKAQCDRIAHSTMLGLGNVPATILAKRLIELAPRSLSRVFYSDAGATAVEIALKLALQYWQLAGETRRTRFVALTEAYHGDTLGAVGVGYSDAFHRFFRPVIAPALRIDPPHVFRWRRGASPQRALAQARAHAAAGDVVAQFSLGSMLYYGEDRLPQAIDWFRKAAAQGYAPAEFQMGQLYDFGFGVIPDVEQAFAWYRTAA